jgi:hypothetical protein
MAHAPRVVAGVIVLVACFFGGRALHPKSGAAYSFQASAPAYEAPKSAAGVDKAGLTGFGEDDLGRTVVSGHVTAFSGDSITLQSASGVVNTIRLLPQAPLRQLTAADRDALRAGANVIVRLSGPDEASAVLILPAQ